MSFKLVAVKKDAAGNITHFLTDRDTIITFSEAQQLVSKGEVDSLTELHSDGSWIIDDAYQHVEGINLGDLPEF